MRTCAHLSRGHHGRGTRRALDLRSERGGDGERRAQGREVEQRRRGRTPSSTWLRTPGSSAAAEAAQSAAVVA
eukprot:scaffold334_cov241-Pinguiococcus_pyrenoidosus.AAC.57